MARQPTQHQGLFRDAHERAVLARYRHVPPTLRKHVSGRLAGKFREWGSRQGSVRES